MRKEQVRRLIKVVAVILLGCWLIAVWIQPDAEFHIMMQQTGGVILGVAVLFAFAMGQTYID